MEHHFHCEDAFRSTAPAVKNNGRQGGGRPNGPSSRRRSKPKGNYARYQARRRSR